MSVDNKVCKSCADIIASWGRQNNGSMAYKLKIDRYVRQCLRYRHQCTKCATCQEHYQHRREYGLEGYKIVGLSEYSIDIEGCGCRVPDNAPVYSYTHRWEYLRCRACHREYRKNESSED